MGLGGDRFCRYLICFRTEEKVLLTNCAIQYISIFLHTSGRASLQVNCSQTRIDVTVITQPRLVGGLLEYVCSTSNKVSLICRETMATVFRNRSRARPFFVELC